MKILDLTNLEKSEIKYRIDKFPDGQQNIIITEHYHDHSSISKNINTINYDDVTIKTRVNNWLDLELLYCSVASLRQLKVKEIHLYCPIIIGSRSDRKFETGGNNYLKQVISPVINSLNFETVTFYDAHSYVSEACINNFENETNNRLFKYSLNKLYLKKSETGYDRDDSQFILVSPDAGALHKINKLAEQINYTGDIITCTKERDNKGKLTQIKVPMSKYQYPGKDFIIIDDICDGGKTFINIAKEIINIRENPTIKPKIYLIVSHLLHDTPNPELLSLFDGIYCTNSRHDKYYEKQGDHLVESKKIHILNIF